MRLHRRQRSGQTARVERPHLLERAGIEHRVKTFLDALLQLIALGVKENLDRAVRIERRRQSVAMPVAHIAAGRFQHFQRAQNARAVAHHQPRRGLRIDAAQFRMQLLDALALQPCIPARADFGIDRRDAGDAGQQRLEIKPGAADEDRRLAGGRRPPRARLARRETNARPNGSRPHRHGRKADAARAFPRPASGAR